MFALVNGDEIFVTFVNARGSTAMFYYYSRVFVYTFTCLFMYIVYSIFTSILITTYETIKVLLRHHPSHALYIDRVSTLQTQFHLYIDTVPTTQAASTVHRHSLNSTNTVSTTQTVSTVH